jgi:glyoxylase-like metal-dependent hydrolase (beta-lactamase superfamily II)
MKLYPIPTGTFKLDGGAMFGVVPKTLWSQSNPADENNLCTWAMRCLLIEDGNRLMLVDTGLGTKQSEKFFNFYYPDRTDSLNQSLNSLGFHPTDITDVLLTHLHFDHCGGAVNLQDDGKLSVAFPNAHYWISEGQWNTSHHPNAREKASFLKENFDPIQASGQLKLIHSAEEMGMNGVELMMVNGHTEQMMLPLISIGEKKVLFLADLMPAAAHIRPSWVMGYDVRPLETMAERESTIAIAEKEKWTLFFEHDAYHEAAQISYDESGKLITQTGTLQEFIG